MKKFLIFILLLTGFFLSSKSNSYALTSAGCGGGVCTIYVYFCNSDPTNWNVSAQYINESNPSNPITIASSANTNGSAPGCPGGRGWRWEYSNHNVRPTSGDQVIWHTACVDPTTNVRANPDPIIIKKTGGDELVYITYASASTNNTSSGTGVDCHGLGYAGTLNKVYAGCYHANYTTKNWGDVNAGAQCPYYDTSSSYCTKGGITAYNASCGASYCGGSGNCTYYNKTCSGPPPGTGCSHPGTAYSTMCGGNSISGTSMCSSYSKSCSPSAPTVTLSAICNGTNPNIRVNYTSNAGSKGTTNYDLRWRASGTSTWNNVCSPPTAGSGYDYVITTTALDDATTYQVQVRQHTISGINGPTNFGSATVTTPTCNPSYIISGTVFIDDGSGGGTAGDGIRNGTEPVFTGGATLTITNTSTGSITSTSSDGSGLYSTSKKNGPYSISITASGYRATSPNPRSVTVSGANVSNVNFGLLPEATASTWYQSVGGDVRQDDGITVDLPTGQYFSASTPTLDGGVVFTSQPSATFGSGTPNQNNWLAKNTSFSPLPPGIKTSYAFIDANATKLGLTPISISTFPSLSAGNFVYKTTGDLTMSGTDVAFPAGTYVFLVNGNLNLDQNIIVPPGSIAMFIVKGDIVVGANVTKIQGVYSADQQFSFDTLGTNSDAPLEVQGSIIGNAALQTDIPFVNSRDLGPAANATTPSIKVVFRPDFVLRVPDLVKKPSYSVSEVAPIGGN